MESVLTPVLVLIAWSLVVWVWMYATRIPAMQKAGVKPQEGRIARSLTMLPDNVRQVADNYNHLMEQPTIFYALAFYTYLVGHETSTVVLLAWIYVILRIVHSLIQGTINVVIVRFMVFSLSTLALVAWVALELSQTSL